MTASSGGRNRGPDNDTELWTTRKRRGNTRAIGSFTVRKISFGEGVERVFPLYSTNIDNITVVRRGRVRRAKLYYLRSRRGKSARIAEVRGPIRAPSMDRWRHTPDGCWRPRVQV